MRSFARIIGKSHDHDILQIPKEKIEQVLYTCIMGKSTVAIKYLLDLTDDDMNKLIEDGLIYKSKKGVASDPFSEILMTADKGLDKLV